MAKKKSQQTPDFRNVPFRELVEQDERLAELRRHYARKSTKERRHAADWTYHESAASDMFGRALSRAGQDASMFAEEMPPGFRALAIDSTFAPAILTVGSIEYQVGRKEEALALFRSLFELPKGTEDLETILDKAKSCLIDQDDYESARAHFEAACSVFPESTLLLDGWGYTLSKLNRLEESLEVHRRAVAVAPNDPEMLNDLGWTLGLMERYDEAEEVLGKAVDLTPPDYDRPWHSLQEVRRRKQMRST